MAEEIDKYTLVIEGKYQMIDARRTELIGEFIERIKSKFGMDGLDVILQVS